MNKSDTVLVSFWLTMNSHRCDGILKNPSWYICSACIWRGKRYDWKFINWNRRIACSYLRKDMKNSLNKIQFETTQRPKSCWGERQYHTRSRISLKLKCHAHLELMNPTDPRNRNCISFKITFMMKWVNVIECANKEIEGDNNFALHFTKIETTWVPLQSPRIEANEWLDLIVVFCTDKKYESFSLPEDQRKDHDSSGREEKANHLKTWEVARI